MVLLRTPVACLAKLFCITPRIGIAIALVLTYGYKYGQHSARSVGITSQEMAFIMPDQRRRFLLMQRPLTWEEYRAKFREESERKAN